MIAVFVDEPAWFFLRPEDAEVVAPQVLAELLALPEEAIFAELSSGTLTALQNL